MNFKEKYRKEIDMLSFSSDCEIRFAEALKKAEERKDTVKIMKKKKTVRLLAAVISAMLIFSLTAYSAVILLSPEQVAQELDMDELNDKWKKSEGFPFVSGNEEYTVSVLGYAPDTELHTIDENITEENRTYIVVSIEKNDGTPINTADGMPLQITPLIQGYEPWKLNLWTLGSGANSLEKDGILYYLFHTGDLEIFADKTVYIAAYEGFLPNEAIEMKENGCMYFKDDYSGFKALFELPLNESKADPEAVKELLSQLGY